MISATMKERLQRDEMMRARHERACAAILAAGGEQQLVAELRRDFDLSVQLHDLGCRCEREVLRAEAIAAGERDPRSKALPLRRSIIAADRP